MQDVYLANRFKEATSWPLTQRELKEQAEQKKKEETLHKCLRCAKTYSDADVDKDRMQCLRHRGMLFKRPERLGDEKAPTAYWTEHAHHNPGVARGSKTVNRLELELRNVLRDGTIPSGAYQWTCCGRELYSEGEEACEHWPA